MSNTELGNSISSPSEYSAGKQTFSDLLEEKVDIRVNSSEASFTDGIFASDEMILAWNSLEERLRARLARSTSA